jgi:hypothetical protein
VAGNATEQGATPVDTREDKGQGHSIFDYSNSANKISDIKKLRMGV